VHAVELEQRYCRAAGCQNFFRSLPTSQDMFCSAACSGKSGYEWRGGTPKGETAAKERQREHKMPDGYISVLEFAARIGAEIQTCYRWIKLDQLPHKKLSARKTGIVFDEAVQAECVKAFMRRKNKEALPPATHPKALERQAAKEAYLHEPDDLRPVPSKVVVPALPPEPLYAAPAITPASEKIPEPITVVAGPPKTISLDENDEGLALRAREGVARTYVKQARRCAANKERQAERVLLWMAIEALGLEQPEGTPQC
jgi:hypothetical protein